MTSKLSAYTVVWYLTFFAPSDLPHRLLAGLPLLPPILAAAQDVMRLGDVRAMVGVGVAEHPASLLVPVVLATLASSGFMVVKYVEQVVVQRDRTFTIRHHATKTMAVAAVLLTLQAHGLVQVEADTIQAAMVLLAITLRLVTSFVMKDWDPYTSVEEQA